ncbi:MAG: hypothetical protein HY834_14835 [Devosia nanyangense]|uniref:Uncharacterized protein n=1 Tax=Devosia nanyangense TaxID=1228055 RepID=A0A933NZR2_9HYPH|nr:hypothetical protein [Devosia nanyangense]
MQLIASEYDAAGHLLSRTTVEFRDHVFTSVQVQHLAIGLEVVVFAGRRRTDYAPLHPQHGVAGHGLGLGAAKFFRRKGDPE